MVWRTVSQCLDALKADAGFVTQAVSRDPSKHITLQIQFGDFLHVVHEHSFLCVALFFVRSPQNRGRMDRRHYVPSERRFYELTAVLGNAKRLAQKRLRRCRPEAYHHRWLDRRHFRIQPRPARRDFLRIRFFVNAAFPARVPLKMLHRICEVHLLAIDPGGHQQFIQQPSCRSYKGLSL